MNNDEIKKGIAAYKNQQNVLLRLIRKTGGLTASKFDDLFRKRRRLSSCAISGDSFILGMGINGGNIWSENLELLQLMIRIDLVDTKRNEHNEIVYVLLST